MVYDREVNPSVPPLLLNPYADLVESLRDTAPELQLRLRKKLIWAYSWAVPSTEAILKIASRSPILELGSGTGYWAWLLQQAGATVRAFDREAHQPPRWTHVDDGDESAVSGFPEHSLLLCWPPLDSPMAARALDAFEGRGLIYVGEWGGRTADSAFHERLKRDWRLVEEIVIPCWPGFVDRVYVLERR